MSQGDAASRLLGPARVGLALLPALRASAAGGSASDIATPELIDVATGRRRNKTREAEL